MKLKVLKQKDAEACGPTTIKMVVDYFNLPRSLKEIGIISKYKQRGGLSNVELVNMLRRLGLKVKTKHNASWADLKKYNTKNNIIILSWMLKGYIGHFSILEKINKDHIYLADSDTGKIVRMHKIIFLRLWFDYDDKWYPKNNTDIQLRWLAVVYK